MNATQTPTLPRRTCRSRTVVITSLAFYLLVASLYLIVVVKYREIRYAYHIVPVVLILSAYGLDRILRRLSGTVIWQGLAPLAVSAVMILAALGFVTGLNQASDKFVERRDNEVIRAGDWMAATYAGENSVLAGTVPGTISTVCPPLKW